MVNKSKKNYYRINKSRKNKKGGRKNNTTRMITQMAGYNTLLSQSGGQAGAAPAPAPAANACPFPTIPNATALGTTLQNFGNAVQNFINAATSTTTAAGLATTADTAQNTASTQLTNAVTDLAKAYYGPSYTNDYGNQATTTATSTGLYELITGNKFVATLAPPAPAPAPA